MGGKKLDREELPMRATKKCKWFKLQVTETQNVWVCKIFTKFLPVQPNPHTAYGNNHWVNFNIS